MRANERQSFGEQAARFSLYAPFAVLIIGVLTAHNRNEPGVATAMLIISIILILAGLGLGVTALILMGRYGRRRILGRAVVGVGFNGLIAVVVVMALLPLVVAGRMKSKLAGHWSTQVTVNHVANTIDLILDKDGTFHFDSASGGAATTSLSGTWMMDRAKVLGVHIEQVSHGDPSAAGQSIGLGRIQSVDDQQMILKTDKGQEVYTRIP